MRLNNATDNLNEEGAHTILLGRPFKAIQSEE